METEEFVQNEHGIWFNMEEKVTNLHEVKFDKEGFWFDDNLLFTWKKLEEIKNRVGKM